MSITWEFHIYEYICTRKSMIINEIKLDFQNTDMVTKPLP